MRCLVTGGAGFIGSHLVDALLARGDDVLVLDDLSTGTQANLPPMPVVIRDISETFDPHIDFEPIDVVFHLAAKARVQPSFTDLFSFHKANVTGTIMALRLAKHLQAKRFVFSSSSSVYGDYSHCLPLAEKNRVPKPQSPYALQKLMGEMYCKIWSQIYGLDTVCLRYFNVYGDRMASGQYGMVLQRFLDLRAEGKPLTVRGDGENRRDYTFVGDVVQANILAADREKPFGGMPLNVGGGQNYSVNEIARMIGGTIEWVDAVDEPKATLADTSLALKELGWEPTVALPDWIARRRAKMPSKD